MDIRIAITDEEIAACFPVMVQLRPNVEQGEFLSLIREHEKTGYRLAFLIEEDTNTLVSVAGFRIGKNLAWERFLYVDDFVTTCERRSKGYGAKLLGWLRHHAKNEGCSQIHLDSSLQRDDAHRFYEREGMLRRGYHFVEAL